MPEQPQARHAQRQPIQVNVDVRPLKTQDVDDILFGQGFEELHLDSLSLLRPRRGMQRTQTLDLSSSGLRIAGMDLKPGTAAFLDLHLPKQRVVVKALVEVVWARKEAEQLSAGCRFAAIQEFAQDRMLSFLQNNL